MITLVLLDISHETLSRIKIRFCWKAITSRREVVQARRGRCTLHDSADCLRYYSPRSGLLVRGWFGRDWFDRSWFGRG